MVEGYKVGDLVHIPQSVTLVDCDIHADPQLTIPIRIHETTHPHLGVVTHSITQGYLRVYCKGDYWSVADSNVYRVIS